MKDNIFAGNNKIVMAHLKVNWKIILFFSLFWLFIAVSLMTAVLVPFDKNMTSAFIRPTQIERQIGNSTYGGLKPTVSQMLNFALFGAPGIVFFIIVLMTMAGRIFSKEINGGQINIWMTSAVSRTQIFYSKFMFIIFSVFIIFIPNFLVILIVSAISVDANQYFGNVLLYGVQFFIFITFMAALVSLVVFYLAEKGPLPFIVISLIALYILVTWIITLISDLGNDLTPKWMSYVKYYSIQSLLVNPLNFDYWIQDPLAEQIIVKGERTYIIQHTLHNKAELWLSIFAPVILLGTATGIVIGTNALFIRKDFNI
ncbi:hypothetical protein [Spiroplasma alleghenense]|uniref:ABC transporter permease n=1 Tax=Spiroplasma alleghenense TaxID=216931 RepID=A0A345Z5C7_9MOLU|nr:hypothetical protein [Spiroplasma alleghenense]AXK51806.1 ABC transporter permease [Spiroplasma alleghenense]